MGLTADQFHNKDNGNFTNVTFVVEKDGYVKINPRPVTLTLRLCRKSRITANR